MMIYCWGAPSSLGFTAGVADAFACHPVDVVKTQAHVNKGVNPPFYRELVAQAGGRPLTHLVNIHFGKRRSSIAESCREWMNGVGSVLTTA
jgi:hypothetical protein